MIIPGPFADGFDSEEYEECLNDAQEFFGLSREECVNLMIGPAVFKHEMEKNGLDWTYDEGQGAIWDLLSVKATVSSGVKERSRETIVGNILEKYLFKGSLIEDRSNKTIIDYGCGIGREALVAISKGAYTIGVDRGLTLEFANFYVNKHQPTKTEDLWDPTGPVDFWKKIPKNIDAIMCFEFFEHHPFPLELVKEFWKMLKPDGLLICNCRSFNAHDTGHLESNFKYQNKFEAIIAEEGFDCIYYPHNPPNIWNIAVFSKKAKGSGSYNGYTTQNGEW